MPLLTIAIPTTPDREELFQRLLNELTYQIQKNDLDNVVNIDWEIDNKEMSIGVKRDLLYKRAQGEYTVQWDSDDWIHAEGIALIIWALHERPDCVTYLERCEINGLQKWSNIALKYPDWAGDGNETLEDGFHFHRTPFFKTPIKTAVCRNVGVKDMRFGEDHDFAQRIKPLLKTEKYIDDPIYHYIHNSTAFNERYGINQD